MSKAAELAALIGSGQAQTASNLIINGGMRIAQRGTSSTTSGYASVDRFKLTYGGGGTITQSQQSLTSGSPYQEGFRSSFRATVTSASNAAGTYAQIEQPIEAQNMAQSGWEYTNSNSSLTFSFWAKSSLAGTYYVQFRTFDTASYYYNKSFTLAASTWKKITCTVAGNSNLTINNDNGEGFRVIVIPDYGTQYTGDAEAVTGAWYLRTQADGYFPNFAQDWHNTGSATFEITGVQLEVGDVATAFEHESFGTTLEKCQRYYVKLLADTAYDAYGSGFFYAAAQFYGIIRVPTRMRTVPTMSTNGSFAAMNNAHHDAMDSLILNRCLVDGLCIETYSNMSTNQGIVGHGGHIRDNNDGDSFIEIIAEL
jgi:hypothetical protein|tara:strand:+ start:609 stop:1712 length:1104 start_codon:yes stop_codon:yes gene_type:complete